MSTILSATGTQPGPLVTSPAVIDVERLPDTLADGDVERMVRTVTAAMAKEVAIGRRYWRQRIFERVDILAGGMVRPSIWPVESVTLVSIPGADDVDAVQVVGAERKEILLETWRSALEWGSIATIGYLAGWAMPAAWVSGGTYAAGSIIKVDLGDGARLLYEAAVGGQVGAADPGFGDALVADGAVQWARLDDASMLPGALSLAGAETVSQWLSGGLSVPAGITSETDDGDTTTFASDAQAWPPAALRVMEAYRDGCRCTVPIHALGAASRLAHHAHSPGTYHRFRPHRRRARGLTLRPGRRRHRLPSAPWRG